MLKFITPIPGPSTTERILELVQNHPQGITVIEMRDILNRPVSMVNICLKPLVSEGKVFVRLRENGMRVYYPSK